MKKKIVLGFMVVLSAFAAFFWIKGKAQNRWSENLVRAINADDIERVETLLDKTFFGVNYDIDIAPDHHFPVNVFFSLDTPLVYACGSASYEMVELLIEHGADVNDSSYQRWTPLEATLMSFEERKDYHDVYRIVELLIENGLDRSQKMNYGESPAKVAAESLPYSPNYKHICGEDGESWNVHDIYDKERAEEIFKIYKRIANWTEVEQDDYILLQGAVAFPNIKILEYMLKEQGLDADSTDSEGQTVLFYELDYKTEEEKEMMDQVIAMLKQYGLDTGKRDKAGMTAMDYAKQSGNQQWIELLEKHVEKE